MIPRALRVGFLASRKSLMRGEIWDKDDFQSVFRSLLLPLLPKTIFIS